MRFLNARSLTPQVNHWLATSQQPRVLHVFERACNVINERREVLSIVTPQIGNGPFNLVLEDPVLFTDFLTSESSMSIQGGQLRLADLTFTTANAKLWDPRPDWDRLHARKNDILHPLTQLELTSSLDSRGFDLLLSQSLDLYSGDLPISKSLISNLSSALITADIASARRRTSQLAGLGAGLTPSCDDFLMGAMYGVWIIHPLEVARVFAWEMANTAAPLTTSLSAAWLKSAGSGEAGIVWHTFLKALLSGDPDQIHETMGNILYIGETSGADALAGFIGTIMNWVDVERSKHH